MRSFYLQFRTYIAAIENYAFLSDEPLKFEEPIKIDLRKHSYVYEAFLTYLSICLSKIYDIAKFYLILKNCLISLLKNWNQHSLTEENLCLLKTGFH